MNWATLSKVESDVICHAMDRLRARGIPACPIYDCLMVPVESTTMATMFLEEACREIVGFAPPEPKIVRNGVSKAAPNPAGASPPRVGLEQDRRPAP